MKDRMDADITVGVDKSETEAEALRKKADGCQGQIAALETELKDLKDQLMQCRDDSNGSKGGVGEDDARAKRMEQRQNVISELVMTEKEYVRDLKLTYETFNLYKPEFLESKRIDGKTLFGNFLEVIHLAENLLDSLQLAMKGKEDADQLLGPSFLSVADEMLTVYLIYCSNHDSALALLNLYTSDEATNRILLKGVETLRHQIPCFDMSSILIKPVQRIAKYPLILNELNKCTEDDHADKQYLVKAVSTMTCVVSTINESKRKKDIVAKYRDESSTNTLSRLTLHSMEKKSARLGMKIRSTFGMSSSTKDELFDEIDKNFKNLEKLMRLFLADVQTFVEQLNVCAESHLIVAETVGDFYKERSALKELEEFHSAHRKLGTEFLHQFVRQVDYRVTLPLRQVLETFQAPDRLIRKRNDKLLDYDQCTERLESNKDTSKTRVLQEEHLRIRNVYQALNSQIIEELPKLTEIATKVFVRSVQAFVHARRTFIGHATEQYLSLMKLPLLLSSHGNVKEVFAVKHSLVSNQLMRFSFSSKISKADTLGRKFAKGSPIFGTKQLGSNPTTKNEQSPSQQAHLRSIYSSDKLYRVSRNYIASDVLDINAEAGHLVAVIKKQDPMGNAERWFVDDGAIKGFLPSSFLTTAYMPAADAVRSTTPTSRFSASPHLLENPQENSQRTASLPPSPMMLTRKRASADGKVSSPSSLAFGGRTPSTSSLPSVTYDLPPPSYEEAVSQALPVPAPRCSSISNVSPPASSTSPAPVESPHRYEEIGGPILENEYEEIKNDHSPSDNFYAEIGIQEQPINEFFVAAYDFLAKNDHGLTIMEGQVIRVLHKQDTDGNTEWWYAENPSGCRGYVPGNYLKKYS